MRQGLASFFLPFFKVFLNPKKAFFRGTADSTDHPDGFATLNRKSELTLQRFNESLLPF